MPVRRRVYLPQIIPGMARKILRNLFYKAERHSTTTRQAPGCSDSYNSTATPILAPEIKRIDSGILYVFRDFIHCANIQKNQLNFKADFLPWSSTGNSFSFSPQQCFFKNSFFNQSFIYENKVLQTLTATKIGWNILYDEPRKCSKLEFCLGGSYPIDYDFINNEAGYLIGMSVPPIMIAQIAKQLYEQWLSKI